MKVSKEANLKVSKVTKLSGSFLKIRQAMAKKLKTLKALNQNNFKACDTVFVEGSSLSVQNWCNDDPIKCCPNIAIAAMSCCIGGGK